VALAWFSFNLYVPMDTIGPRNIALITLVPQIATIARGLSRAAAAGRRTGHRDGSYARRRLTVPDLPALSSSAEELIAAIGLEPRDAPLRRHLEPLQTSPVRGSTRLRSLSSPSQVPCQSSPSIQVTPVTKRLDSIVRRIAPGLGIDLMDLPAPIVPHPQRPFRPREPRVAAAAGAGIVASTRPVFGSIFWMRSSAS
jgi:hypothetical protein